MIPRQPRSTLFPYTTLFRSTLDVRQVLRETMFAATVTGSPLQNATRVISRYEPTGRGYNGLPVTVARSEEHTSELQSHVNLVCRLLLEKKNRILRNVVLYLL